MENIRRTGDEYRKNRSIKSDYFKSYYLINEMKKDYESGISLLDMQKIYDQPYEIKRKAKVYGWHRPIIKYSIDEAIKHILNIKKTRNQGFSSAVKIDDNLMLFLDTFTDKNDSISKRCFDVVYPDSIKKCLSCCVSLKFSTFDTGYGSYKGKKICGKCRN